MTERIVSPVPREARPYQGMRAGLVSRFIAGAIDLGVVVGVLLSVYAGWCVVRFLLDPKGFEFPRVSVPTEVEAGFIVLVIYLTLAWVVTGRTYGNHVMGLRVVNYRGNRMRPSGAFVRALFCGLFPIGLIWVAFSRANRSLQDVALRTSVIYDWQPAHPHDVHQEFADGQNATG